MKNNLKEEKLMSLERAVPAYTNECNNCHADLGSEKGYVIRRPVDRARMVVCKKCALKMI